MTANKNIFISQLPNGLRIAVRNIESPVEYCGIAVNAGSRDETPDKYGIAHFVEHTIFKGTVKRKSWHIISRMEAVGGELNAYTSEEVTMVYSGFPAGNLSRAMELISDLIANSRFPQTEIDREREVILEEVDSYLDTPSEAIFDDFNDLIFKGSSLGHNILGTETTIKSFTPSDCREFLDNFYIPSNMVFFYTGKMAPEKVQAMADKFFGTFNHNKTIPSRSVPSDNPIFDKRVELDTHQTHTIIGARIPGMYDSRKYAYALLVNILGGPCMNSRLNISLRERHGLVYSVDSYIFSFTDSGTITTYFGCDKESLAKCKKLFFNVVDDLAQSKMTEKALGSAKKQYLGQLILSSVNQEQFALSTARSTLFHNYIASSDEIREHIMSVTPEQISEAAATLTRNNASILTFG